MKEWAKIRQHDQPIYRGSQMSTHQRPLGLVLLSCYHASKPYWWSLSGSSGTREVDDLILYLHTVYFGQFPVAWLQLIMGVTWSLNMVTTTSVVGGYLR